ncbi:hypothetical protein [uncultured Salegentibacter sp.]|nr:hypothetical protein [uncultured Salegentibacter sp.]
MAKNNKPQTTNLKQQTPETTNTGFSETITQTHNRKPPIATSQ